MHNLYIIVFKDGTTIKSTTYDTYINADNVQTIIEIDKMIFETPYMYNGEIWEPIEGELL